MIATLCALLIAAALGYLAAAVPRMMFLRDALEKARGCPCGRTMDEGVVFLSFNKKAPQSIRFIFFRCSLHGRRIEEILMPGEDLCEDERLQ